MLRKMEAEWRRQSKQKVDDRLKIYLNNALNTWFGLMVQDIYDYDELFNYCYNELRLYASYYGSDKLGDLLDKIAIFLIGLHYPRADDSDEYRLFFDQELASYKMGG